jgi:SEL1 protein
MKFAIIVLFAFVITSGSSTAEGDLLLEKYQAQQASTFAVPSVEIPSNISETVARLTAEADGGSPQAQFELGTLYSVGWGVPKSTAQAVLLYTLAAQGGDIDAHMALGYRHEHGYGVEKSCHVAVAHYWAVARTVVDAHHGTVVSAIPWARLASDNNEAKQHQQNIVQYRLLKSVEGEPKAHLSLGYTFMYGLMGQQQDGAKAEKYFRQAAAAGELTAYGALGQLYSRGAVGIPRNHTAALEYFEMGARHGDIASLNGVGLHHAQGLVVPQNISKAIRYFVIGAGNGNPEAHYNLGMLYLGGVGVPMDFNKARTHLAIASQHGQAMARFRLGELYREGKGIEQSCAQAVTLFRAVAIEGPRMRRMVQAHSLHEKGDKQSALFGYLMAAECGVEAAESNTAYLMDHHHQAFEGIQYPASALAMYTRAGTQGASHALVRAGDLLMPTNPERGMQYYISAEMKRSARGAFSLAQLYHFGSPDGTTKVDYEMAKKYYDLTVTYDPNTEWPVTFMMWHMYLQRSTSSTTSWGTFTTAAQYLSEAVYGRGQDMFGVPLENVLLWVLCGTLCVLVYLRQVIPA